MELREAKRRFQQRGGTVLAVSVDAPEKSLELANRLKIDYPLLSDASRKTIKAYKALDPKSNPFFDPDTRYPNISKAVVFVVDPDGAIQWKYVSANLHDRPTTKEILDAVKAAAERRSPESAKKETP